MLARLVLSGAVRGALLLGLTLAAMPLLRATSAATRRLVLALALAGALVAPVVSVIAPAWHVPTPVGLPSVQPREALEPPVAEPVAPVHHGVAQPAAAATARAPARGLALSDAIGGVWLLGALLVLARLAAGLARAGAIARRATPAASWLPALARARAALGVDADVRTSAEVDAPAVTGVVWPVVLVPRAAAAWSEARRDAVLLHELAHVRERDCLAQIVAQLACAAHWFNPLAWLAARRLRLERELAADDVVLAAGTRASSYAEDLLAIAGVARALPLGALGMGEGARLVARIGAVLAAHRARAPLSRVRTLGLAAIVGSVVMAVACATPTESPPPAPVPRVPATPSPPEPSEARTTIDPRLQAIASDELDRALREWNAPAGAVIVLDPATGEIRASAGRDHGIAAEVGVRGVYVTGSTLKAITLAGALDDGVVSATDSFDCEHGARQYPGHAIHDATPYGTLTVPEMLAVSSNVGFSKLFDRLGGGRLDHWLRAFHFGTAPPIDGASTGTLPAQIEDRSYAGATVAIGESATASPLQIAAAYAALANGGVYVAPTFASRSGPAPGEQIVKPETAHAVVTMLEAAVTSELATGKLARIDAATVAGKTGTAAWVRPGDGGGEGRFASFVGFVPSRAPRFVIFVGVEQPSDDGSGGKVAAPVFARIATRALAGGPDRSERTR